MWQSTGHYSNDVDGIATDDNGYIYQLVDFGRYTIPAASFFLLLIWFLVFQIPVWCCKIWYEWKLHCFPLFIPQMNLEFNSIVERNGKLYIAGSMDAGTMDVDPYCCLQPFSSQWKYVLLCYASSLGINSFLWGFSDPTWIQKMNSLIFQKMEPCMFPVHLDSSECDPTSGFLFNMRRPTGTIFTLPMIQQVYWLCQSPSRVILFWFIQILCMIICNLMPLYL